MRYDGLCWHGFGGLKVLPGGVEGHTANLVEYGGKMNLSSLNVTFGRPQ